MLRMMCHRPGRGPAGLAALAGGLLLSACAPVPRPPGTAVVASGADLEDVAPVLAVHPLTRQVHRFVWGVTLVRMGRGAEVEPYLAREWRWSADRRDVRLRLSRALRWHDGTPTTAHDAAFTLARVRDPRSGAPRRGDLAGLTDVAALDDSTLRLVFADPQPRLPLVLAELPLLPRHRWARIAPDRMRAGDWVHAGAGNGPFRFAARRRGASWVFTRNAQFPAELGGPPHLERLVITVVDEPATKLAGLVSGALDMAGVAPTMAGLVARDPTLVLRSPPVLFTSVLLFHPGRAPFDDVRVRRAVSLALQRQRLVDAALAGFGTIAGSAVPPGVLPEAPPAAREDTTRADALLDAAGWGRGADGWRQRAGVPLAIELWTVGSGDLALEQLLQADLAARGIRVRLRAQEFTSFLAALRAPLSARPFDLAVTGLPGDVALGHLEALLHSRGSGGALDLARVHAPALDAAIDGARRQDDPRAALRAWREVDAVLDSLTPVAWLYHAKGVLAHRRAVSQVTIDLRGELATVAEWRVGGR
jgi:peptide/nickel transport system substrate-binding protein